MPIAGNAVQIERIFPDRIQCNNISEPGIIPLRGHMPLRAY